jgi:hypothetical protein
MEAIPTIVIAIDGLRASALGTYGQTTYETPAFDALTAESRTYEWVYARTPDPTDFYAALASHLPTEQSVLVTDDKEATAVIHPRFGAVVEIEPTTPTEPAPTIEDTTTAATWAAMAEALVEANATGSQLIWLHTSGLYSPWDAPAELMESLIDEDDPEITPDVTPPDVVTHDDDERFAASCRYSAQVMTLDACLGGLLDIVDGVYEGEDYRLIVLGLRGFPLGEHGRIGGVDQRLFSEQQHTPLLVREPGADARLDRSATPSTLDAVVSGLLAGTKLPSGPVVLSSSDSKVIISEEWLLRAPADSASTPELYVKPDDRWEQNDIASLEEELTAELLAMLSSPLDSGVASVEGGH